MTNDGLEETGIALGRSLKKLKKIVLDFKGYKIH